MVFMIDRPDLDNFALVFTMGKVGSTALMRSLEAVNVFCRHIQFLSPEWQLHLDKFEHHIDPIELALTRLNVRRCYHSLSNPYYASLVTPGYNDRRVHSTPTFWTVSVGSQNRS